MPGLTTSPRASPGRKVCDIIKSTVKSLRRAKSTIDIRTIRVCREPRFVPCRYDMLSTELETPSFEPATFEPSSFETTNYDRYAAAADLYTPPWLSAPPRTPATFKGFDIADWGHLDRVVEAVEAADQDVVEIVPLPSRPQTPSERRPSVTRSEVSNASIDTLSSLATAEADLLEVLYRDLAGSYDKLDMSFCFDSAPSSSSAPTTPASSPPALVFEKDLPDIGFETPVTTPTSSEPSSGLFSARFTPPKRCLRRDGPVPTLGSSLALADTLCGGPFPGEPSPPITPTTLRPPSRGLAPIARCLSYGESLASLSDEESDFSHASSTSWSRSSSPTPSDLDPFSYEKLLPPRTSNGRKASPGLLPPHRIVPSRSSTKDHVAGLLGSPTSRATADLQAMLTDVGSRVDRASVRDSFWGAEF